MVRSLSAMDRLYLGLATLFFAGGFIYALACLRAGTYRHSTWNFAAMLSGLVFQTLFLYERGQVHGRCPVTNGVEILMFVAWSMVLIYLLVGRNYRLSLMGVFTSPLVFLTCVMALVFPLDLESAIAAAQAKGRADAWVEFHVGISLLAYGAFGMSFIAGLMFLIQERQVRKGNLKILFYNLPPMQNLCSAVLRLLVVGTILLTAGIASAHVISVVGDQHPIWPLYLIWVVYSGLCTVTFFRGLSPRRLAIGAIGAFLFSLASLWLIAAN
ncbi:MAG: cytochrome c biogenesis protein CcsA [Verrucomicrobiales bacterium]